MSSSGSTRMSEQNPHSPQTVNGEVVSAVDWLGNRFQVGDKVMYCISAGRGQMMAIGEVIQIKNEVKQSRRSREAEPGEEPDTQYTALNGTHYRSVYVYTPYDDVTVQVRTLKTSGRWNHEARTKPAWVNPMNITAIKPVEVP